MRLRCGWDEFKLSLTVFSKGGCVPLQRGYPFAGLLLTYSICKYLSGHSRGVRLCGSTGCNILLQNSRSRSHLLEAIQR
jgi:hypothetical protein